MQQMSKSVGWFTSRCGLTAVCILVTAFVALPLQVNAQGRGGRSGGGSPQRGGGGTGGVAHARREVVRTREPSSSPRYVPPPSVRTVAPQSPSRPAVTEQRPRVAASGRAPVKESPEGIAHRAFTRTPQGRHYDNGMQLRHGIPVSAAWQRRYFTHGVFHYPFYFPTYDAATVVISPFGFYFGVCAPFILRSHCFIFPPPAVYIDIPIFAGSTCQGYAPISPDDNYLDLDALREREPGLANAIDELRETFGRGDIDALVAITDPKTRIAIFEKGVYQYSLDSSDFVDMSRDAIQSTQTIAFDLTMIHERAAGVYVVSGEHIYTDHDGHSRKVYVSYVLEDLGDVWTLTQVGTAPDRIQAWK